MTVRESIEHLSPSQKGSFGETLFLTEFCPEAGRISHLGQKADVLLPDGRKIDIKLHRRRPCNRSTVEWFWIDYLSSASIKSGETRVWSIRCAEPATLMSYLCANAIVESHFESWRLKKRKLDTAGSRANVNRQKEAVLGAAQQIVRQRYANVDHIRFLHRQVSTIETKTVAPAIYSHNAIMKYPAGLTIVLVGDDAWTRVSEYWVFDHATPFAELQGLVEPIERRDLQWRFIDASFPSTWKHPL